MKNSISTSHCFLVTQNKFHRNIGLRKSKPQLNLSAKEEQPSARPGGMIDLSLHLCGTLQYIRADKWRDIA